MDGRIVEAVACNHLCFIVAVAVAKARSIIVHPGNCAAVLFHRTDVADILQVGYTMIHLVKKSGQMSPCITWSAEIGRGTDAVEAIDDEHRLFLLQALSNR